jgi:hypothetical protein
MGKQSAVGNRFPSWKMRSGSVKDATPVPIDA